MEINGEYFYETLEEAQEALQKAFSDFIGYYVYKGEGMNAVERARSMVADQCEIVKLKLQRRVHGK